MTLPSSGALTHTAIQTEFGGTNPITMSEYYGRTANIAASGAIKMSMFYGQSALTVNAQTFTAESYDSAGSAGNYQAAASITFHANGKAVVYAGTINDPMTPQTSWNWLVAGSASAVDLKVTGYSGDALSTSLVLNQRYVLSTDRTLLITASASDPNFQTKSNSVSYSLVANSGGGTLQSSSGTLYAEAGFPF